MWHIREKIMLLFLYIMVRLAFSFNILHKFTLINKNPYLLIIRNHFIKNLNFTVLQKFIGNNCLLNWFNDWKFYNFFIRSRYTPLPYLTKELNRVSFIELTDKVHDNFEPLEHFKIFLMSLETRISNDSNTGEIVIYDCAQANLNLIKQLTPSILKKAVDINLVSMRQYFVTTVNNTFLQHEYT